MNGATIQARIYKGYAIAALKIGVLHDQYRPTSALNPISLGNRLTSLPVSFNSEDFSYMKPNKYGKPTWFAVVDGAQTKVGDYLKGPTGTFFIAAQQPLLPILAVECNRTVSVYRPQQQTGIGAQGYGGDTDANETLLMQAWPASVLQGPKGEKSEAHLPGDTKNAWAAVLMPAFTGVVLRSDDILIDDLARRFVLSSVELTDLGYRMTAMQAQT